MTPDFSLIQDYRAEDDHESIPAAMTHFTNGSKNLYYVAAQHDFGTQTPTCITAKRTFEKYSPKFVIIEGLETARGVSPQDYLDASPDSEATADEQSYTAKLAHKKGIPFIGGEPVFSQVTEDAIRSGYTAKEVMAMSSLAMVPHLRKLFVGKSPVEQEFLFSHIVRHNPKFRDVPETDWLTFEEFKAWYDQHKVIDKPFLEIETKDFDPINAPGASYFQKLTAVITKAREKHLDTTIAKALQDHDDVMVVYGGGHLVLSRPVFEDMFGAKGEKTQFVAGATSQEQKAQLEKETTDAKLLPKDRVDRSPQALIARGRGNTTAFSHHK